MRGRNTFVVSIRFNDDIRPELSRRADENGLSIGEYIRMAVIRGLKPQTKPLHTAMDAIMALPVYDPVLHPKGTPVRLYNEERHDWSRIIAP